jgi:hypothetical protein
MQAEIENIEKQIAIAIERSQINQIVCVNYEYEKNNTTLEKVNEFLNLNMDNKIYADLLYFFNDLHDLKTNVVRDNENEEAAIEFQIQESIQKLEIKSLEILKEKIYILELNNCFVKILEQVNYAIDSMNYHHWLANKNPNANKDVLYLLINNEHKTFTKFEINIDSSQGQQLQIASAFCNRQEKLKTIKEAILNFYAKEIFTPYKSAIPEFDYACKKVDICELAYAIQLSNTSFNEPELIAQTILKMFKISKDDYSKAQGEIRKRKKDKNIFIKKLSENIEALNTPKINS